MHAQELSLRLRRAMLAALAAPALIACGGTVDNGDSGTDSGNDPDVLKPPPGCDTHDTDAGIVGCGGKSIQLSGDISKCNVTSDSGQVPMETCVSICGGQQYSYCTFDASTNVIQCEGICVGRLPARLRDAPKTHGNAVGDYLARAAYLEAAAVGAFAILAAELRAHGAPESLTRSAERARADEVRHAREVGTLARAFGATPATPRIEARPIRALVDIAIENAIEGCVRETFGALVASWQGEHAEDLRVRRAMKRIARDETRHAALGWRIFDWAHAQLDPSERARVDEALTGAIDDLDASSEPNASVAQTLGVPNAAETSALVAAMRSELWAPSLAA